MVIETTSKLGDENICPAKGLIPRHLGLHSHESILCVARIDGSQPVQVVVVHIIIPRTSTKMTTNKISASKQSH
jgi:hypothetical protein